MEFVENEDLNYDTRVECLVNVGSMHPGEYDTSPSTSEVSVLTDLMGIVNKSFVQSTLYLGSHIARHIENRIRVSRYRVEHVSGAESDDLDRTKSDLMDGCLRLAIVMETFREFIQTHGMLFISGDFVVHSDGQPEPSTVSGFSKLHYEPTPITMTVDSNQDVRLYWRQSVYFDDPSDKLMGLRTTSHRNHEGRTIFQSDGNYGLIINRNDTDDPFIHHQELHDHVFCASQLFFLRQSPSHGGRSIEIDMQLGLDDLLVMCNEMLLRMGVMNPFEVLFVPEHDADGNSLYMKALFRLFMKYAERCVMSGGFRDPRAVIIVLAVVCLMEYDRYRPLQETVPTVLTDQYSQWLAACTGSSLRLRTLTNTLGNFYLLKSSMLSNMLDAEFRNVAGDQDTPLVPYAITTTLAVRKMLISETNKLHSWALQLRLPGMDVHEFLIKYALQDYDHLYRIDMSDEIFRAYLDVLRWYKPDFEITPVVQNSIPVFPEKRFTQHEARLLLENVPDFSDFTHAEVTHRMLYEIQRHGADRQARLLRELGYSG